MLDISNSDLLQPPVLKNALVVPPWLFAQIKYVMPEKFCPDDRAYVIDNEGHVRALKIMGKLVDHDVPRESA